MIVETSLPYYRARLSHHEAELERAMQRIETGRTLQERVEALGEATHELAQVELYRGVVRAYERDYPLEIRGAA